MLGMAVPSCQLEFGVVVGLQVLKLPVEIGMHSRHLSRSSARSMAPS